MGAIRGTARVIARSGGVVLSAIALASFAHAQASLTCNQPFYVPGTYAQLTGSGFDAGETVSLRVTRFNGTQTDASFHVPWSVQADEFGGFVTSWQACEGCYGLMLVATADGELSGEEGTTNFSVNHECGDGVVTSVTPVGAFCSDFTPAVGSGPDTYEVQEGGTYVMTISGVTECEGDTITVFVQSSESGNFCFNATGGGGTYSGQFTMPNPACNTMPVSYKCGAGADCTHADSFAAQGPTSDCGGVHLRASYFDGGCNATEVDDDCDGCTPTCDIECPGDVTIDCSESTDPSNTGSPTGCPGATHEDTTDDGNCAGNYVITRVWSVENDCGETRTCTQTITVQDMTPPTIECPPPVEMTGCCVMADIGEPTVTDCSPVTLTNNAPDTFCTGTTIVTWTAEDECGNQSTCDQTVTVNDITIDFEKDGLGANLLHGQSLVTVGPEAAYACITISSGPDPLTPGTGNNGAAVFNSTSGPFGQDPDLAVGLGNVLYCQRNGGATDAFTGINGPDTWDHPNDDEDGGSLVFDFCGGIQPLSIDLIDIDAPAPAQNCLVILTDVNTKTRTYTVPGAWTDDGPGPNAVGTLLLNATGSQPGFAANATESTQAGYDGTMVVKIEVRLGSSGAVDNLHCCPTTPKATATVRNGSGINPLSLTTHSVPVLGASWGASLDCTGMVSGNAIVEVRRAAVSGQLSPFGEVLIGGERIYRVVKPFTRTAFPMPATRVHWSVPHDVTLAGLELHVQGMCQGIGASAPKLFQIRNQLSNALDLVLGF